MADGIDPRAVHDRAEAEDKAQRRVAASARWREFAELPEAEGKTRTAIHLADDTNMTLAEARAVLRAAPPDEQH